MQYYIYHIPGIKIGCTTGIHKRMSDQGFANWEILETHTCIYAASDREIELQKQYGLPVDKVPYWKSVDAWNKKSKTRKGQSNSNEHNSKISQNCKGLKRSEETAEKIRIANTGRTHSLETRIKISLVNKGRVSDARKLTFEIAQEIRAKYVPRKYGYKKLAAEYGVAQGAIQSIIENRSYLK